LGVYFEIFAVDSTHLSIVQLAVVPLSQITFVKETSYCTVLFFQSQQ
jgi:hypothetical protein